MLHGTLNVRGSLPLYGAFYRHRTRYRGTVRLAELYSLVHFGTLER